MSASADTTSAFVRTKSAAAKLAYLLAEYNPEVTSVASTKLPPPNAHCLDDPPVALDPEEYSFAENRLLATAEVSLVAHDFAEPNGAVVPVAYSFAEYSDPSGLYLLLPR